MRFIGFYPAPFTVVFLVFFVAIAAVSSFIQEAKVLPVSDVHPRQYYEDAWTDLQVISKTYHPYMSHANDDVHDYILRQVQEAVNGASVRGVEIDNDWGRRIFFEPAPVFKDSESSNAIYFEGNNVLVKIPGRNSSLGAVLLSGHFDSVPTGHGTTDAGAGIASMLGTLRYLLDLDQEQQPLRTIIFNFNNNEEFGLLGAEAFRFHPWFDQVALFVNLEGAGAFGRPVLFRATDYGVMQHFDSPNPHASSVLQQGFASGIVHSQTDYKVYSEHGRRGVDIAFYKSRSLYHTERDNIQGSSVGALSHMMNSAIGTVLSMANSQEDFELSTNRTEPPAVFFDLFDKFLVVVPLSTVLQLNSLGLVIIPICIGLLIAVAVKTKSWRIGRRGWARGAVSLIVSCVSALVCTSVLKATNPLVFVSQKYAPLIGCFSVFILVNFAFLRLADYMAPVHDQKLVIFLESLAIWWVVLLACTIIEAEKQATGYYLATVLYYSTAAAVIIGLMSHIIRRKRPNEYGAPAHSSDTDREEDEENDAHNTDNSSNPESHANGDVADETTSLLGNDSIKKKQFHQSPSYDWILQFLAMTPSFYLIYSTTILILDAMHQAVVDGSEAVGMLCNFVLLSSIACGILVMPFVHRMSLTLVTFLAALAVTCGASSLFRFPFTHDAPLKMRMLQDIDLTSPEPEPLVRVLGDYGYVSRALKGIPSIKSHGQNVNCDRADNGLEQCAYVGPRPWSVPEEDYSDWLRIDVAPQTDDVPSRGEITIHAPDTRLCYLKFNSSGYDRPVKAVRVFHSLSAVPYVQGDAFSDDVDSFGWRSGSGVDVFTDPKGIESVTVHKLNWTEPGFRLGFDWVPIWYEDGQDQTLGVRVECHWGESDDILVDGKLVPKVEALNELIEYGPRWTSWTNRISGLVQVWKYIEL
uniref:Peptide hydrolase n=1 Tax=Blastobotrys adeninivorans TaxID=409370 RepID=A0A060SXM4_BLAAD